MVRASAPRTDGSLERKKRENYQNRLKLLKIIMDKSAIWQLWLWHPTSGLWVSTFFFWSRLLGISFFLIQASADVFFGTAPGESTWAPFWATFYPFYIFLSFIAAEFVLFPVLHPHLTLLTLTPNIFWLPNLFRHSIYYWSSHVSLGWLASLNFILVLQCYSIFLQLSLMKMSFIFSFLRPSTSDILWAGLLVLHFLLWAEPAGRRDLPRLATLADGGRLYRPFQLGALLPGPAVQCEPQLCCGAYAQTYRYHCLSVGSAKAI